MAKIGIFDSGVGGLSVFRELRKVLPDEQYVFFSDNANCPYGEKSQQFIQQRAGAITDLLLSKGCDLVVVACNTATAAAISYLRETYDVKFVGMEPAVKMAANLTKNGVIGVLATAGTLGGSKYHDVKQKFGGGVKIVERVGKGFVELVEAGILNGEQAEKVVGASLAPMLDAGADTIVLGCTHYPFLRDTIQKLAGEGVTIIDPAPSVAKHTVDVLLEEGIATGGGSYSVELLSSGPDDALRRTFELI